MNIANKEFEELAETGIDFAYGVLSKVARQHGSPQELIEDIYSNGYLDGYSDATQAANRRALVIGAGLLLAVGVGLFSNHLYKKHKKKTEESKSQICQNAQEKAEHYAKSLLTNEKQEHYSNQSKKIISVDFKTGT